MYFYLSFQVCDVVDRVLKSPHAEILKEFNPVSTGKKSLENHRNWSCLNNTINLLLDRKGTKSLLIYKKALTETFDQDNVYTWKSLCPKCYPI